MFNDLSTLANPDLGPTAARVSGLNWEQVEQTLDQQGYSVLTGLATPDECDELSALYPRSDLYRSRVVMSRHGFGRGEYQYFSYPLPAMIEELRTTLYPHLVPIANRWNQTMDIDVRYPGDHAAFVRQCHRAGQTRPTPLILQYGVDDYNCLHQDLYGEHAFPLQVALLLSQPHQDFAGGQFMLTEQSGGHAPRAEVVPLDQGDAVVFAVNQRPVPGTRGYRRAAMRHGVSRIHAGRRYTLGIIFHDAR